MVNPVFQPDHGIKVSEAKLLVVGAGGIGCELLKNLVLTGFKNIKVVSVVTTIKDFRIKHFELQLLIYTISFAD